MASIRESSFSRQRNILIIFLGVLLAALICIGNSYIDLPIITQLRNMFFLDEKSVYVILRIMATIFLLFTLLIFSFFSQRNMVSSQHQFYVFVIFYILLSLVFFAGVYIYADYVLGTGIGSFLSIPTKYSTLWILLAIIFYGVQILSVCFFISELFVNKQRKQYFSTFICFLLSTFLISDILYKRLLQV